MSSAGVTLQGSFSGETGTISETGFYYGTNSGNLGTKVTSGSTTSPFSKSITGLSANTTYYYKAYVVEYNESTSSTEERLGSELSFITKAVATSTVTSVAADPVGSNSATMKGSFSGATGNIQEAGIVWTTNASLLNNPTANSESLNWAYVDNCLGATASGNISAAVTGLTPETTYYYRAFVAEFNENTGSYEYRYGSQRSVTTTAAQTTTPTGYLDDYGMPDISGLSATLRDQSNSRSSDRDDYWYSYNTNNNKRQIAVHTYTDGAPNSEETLNYVVLYDETKYAPVWTYHVMNSTYWPDNNAGRNTSWGNDPAISLAQQSGLDDADNVGYSRGHLVASDYRQSSVKQNKQTFYYSNQAPQWQNSFNDGVWSSLETRVKNQTPSGTTMLYVVTGVLYEGTISTLPSGAKNVPIPSHFYKCIMKCTFSGTTITGAQGIAFVYTNQAHVTKNTGLTYYGTDANTGNECFVTSIDAIETRAGFDFFARVPTSLQNSAEANTSHTWFTGAN